MYPVRIWQSVTAAVVCGRHYVNWQRSGWLARRQADAVRRRAGDSRYRGPHRRRYDCEADMVHLRVLTEASPK